MLSDKNDVPVFKDNPGVMIGKDEMIKYIDFVRSLTSGANRDLIETSAPAYVR